MISSNKSLESNNALMQRIQRYSKASTIFHSTDNSGDMAHVQRATNAPAKAMLLPGPSSLPVGRTTDSRGVSQGTDSISMMPNAFPAELSTMPEVGNYSVSAAIAQVTQMQRSSDPQDFTSPQTTQPQIVPTFPPVIDSAPTQAAPKATGDSNWTRLQRIFNSHEAKNAPVADSQPTPSTAPTMQHTETEPPAIPDDSIQRAISTAESSQSPTPPKKAPLESIWPVQKTKPEATGTSDEPVVMRQPGSPISTEPVQTPAEEQTIRNKLNDVSVTQRSDSSVELHLPRRPRPAVIQTKSSKEDANKSFWDRLRKTEGKEPDAVQRTVETEIGPLPADMWELLGETPPGSPTETVAASGESTPTIQPKREENPAHEAEVPSMPLSDSENTDIPSFLAEAATTAQPASDAIQRAIAAAESPEITPDTTKITESTESTTPPVQRKETTTPSTPSAPASSASLNSESATTSTDTEATIAVEAASPAPASSPTETSIQRSTVSPANAESESIPEQQDETPTTNQSTPKAITPDVSIPTESTSNQASEIQRAIQAAEASTTPNQEIQTPPPTASVPTVTPTTSATEPLQPMRSDSAEPSLTKKPTTSRGSESNAQELSSVDATSGNVSDSVQRATTTLKSESSSFVPHTVDLNAETGPLPALADDTDGGKTAVSPSSQSPDTSSAIQRAIAAAETPPATDEPTVSKSERPLAAPPIIQMKKSATDGDPQQANLSQESVPLAPPLETTSSTEPAVPSPAASTPETIQRTIAAAETVSEPSEITPDAQTAVTPSTTETTTPDALQRAIAAAETPPSTPSIQSETAVSPPTTETTTADSIQRAVAAAETPSSTPSVQSETVVNTPTAKAKIPTADTIQRAIAATETTASDPFTVYNSQATTNRPQTAVQRAIAAAEMAPNMKTTTPVIQRVQTAPQTSPTTPTAFIQDSGWQGQTETATSAPLSAGVATLPPPTITQTATPSLMRAISTAESPPERTQEAYQWPDISPTTAAQSQNNIQRVNADEESSDFQEYEADSASDMESAESENEGSPVDVDKLTNEVYSQLRKRLAIEWERGRGKR